MNLTEKTLADRTTQISIEQAPEQATCVGKKSQQPEL